MDREEIKAEMIKEIQWNIDYLTEKLEKEKLKLSILLTDKN